LFSQIRDDLEHGSGSNEARRHDQEEDMSRLGQHAENHLVDRIGWMRAAVLGANDGIVSTASLIVGVAAAAAN
jgi:VIT1/CCC1 family predicted Fe2+/Mn2+ transporter